MDLGLDGRVFVVTGASRGLGRATARTLAAEGARLVVSARDKAAVDAVVAELRAGAAAGVAADNADPATPARLVAAARDSFGRIDGALISVGGPPAGPVAAVSDGQWRDAFESVFLGAVRLARVVSAELGEGGSVACVLSSSVRAPLADLAISNGLRPGLAGVVKTLADEMGPRGVRVNGLLPGRIDTDRVRELDAASGDPARARVEKSAAIPLRRYGEPEEFARVAAFVLSPAASYVTGAMITVDGGVTRSW